MKAIPFTRSYITPKSLEYVAQCCETGSLQGGGPFSVRSAQWIEKATHAAKVLLTASCTDALEMSALLLDLKPGDEVIMPSYTFTSSATAFALRGAVPVFVDIRSDTINIDEKAIEAAITPRTKAILIVHYGGVACDMERIMNMADKHKIAVIEDAAHAYGAHYKGKALGTFGVMGTYSFHNTKNISSGEGGALLINDLSFAHRAEILHEKGTDRSRFMRGDVAFYTWQDLGSSFLMSDLAASFLLGQLEIADDVNDKRLQVWQTYHKALAELEQDGKIRRPVIPEGCEHNAHLYYILLPDSTMKNHILNEAKAHSIGIISHYVPLHTAPAGLKYGRTQGNMNVTKNVTDRLVRLPMFAGITDEDVQRVIAFVLKNAGQT